MCEGSQNVRYGIIKEMRNYTNQKLYSDFQCSRCGYVWGDQVESLMDYIRCAVCFLAQMAIAVRIWPKKALTAGLPYKDQ